MTHRYVTCINYSSLKYRMLTLNVFVDIESCISVLNEFYELSTAKIRTLSRFGLNVYIHYQNARLSKYLTFKYYL